MVAATIDVYFTIVSELLPTPAKPHYTFNLRDIASVMQGCLSADPKEILAPADMVALWVHENARVYYDRLVSVEDRSWYGPPPFFSLSFFFFFFTLFYCALNPPTHTTQTHTRIRYFTVR
ncbi:hypothetical protein T492DRAFT_353499 [Pavlovales sp. CCMP2436]|nr:hypothetical protein T492DRAFT_353499 [Pavlovales sp. CCMP2436]